MGRRVRSGVLAAMAWFAVGACQPRLADAPTGSPPPVREAQSIPAAPAAPPAPEFGAWLMDLRREAQGKGVSASTLEAALAHVQPIPRVIELDRRQPEFTQTFRRYMDAAVSAARVRDGAAKLRENRALLAELEQAYGVPGRFLVAFWGMETNYGRTLGGFSVVGALSTLAYDGRRSRFFRGELIDALVIIDRGHVAPDQMIGSWAGAMGQTQFMPSTFLKHAIDQSGDGRIDVWRTSADALGSGANYLRNLGWDPARTWGREVRLPASFDAGLSSLDGNASETVKSLAEWAALGVRRSDGSALSRQDLKAALLLPAGHRGPAFLVYDNFRAILKWNRSTFYALAVGHLADRIAGGLMLTGRMVDDAPLSRAQVVLLQTGLQRLGFLDAEPDGVLGSGTRAGARRFQQATGRPPDGYIDQGLLRAVVDYNAGTQTSGSALLGGVAFAESTR